MTVEKILSEWEHNRNKHPLIGEKISDIEILRMWDESAKKYDTSFYSNIANKIINKLDLKGLISGSILDIGCGPGTFSIPFSKKAKNVIALDSSEQMLMRLKETCNSEKIDNISPLLGDCNNIPRDVRCDLVFSSLCPPMNNPESLLKMEKHGFNFAYVSSANTGTSIETEVWSKLGKDYSYSGYNTKYPYDFLKSIGRKVELEYFTQKNIIIEPQEETIKKQLRLFSRYHYTSDKIHETIKSVVSRYSDGEYVNYSREMTMGLILWSGKDIK